MMYNNGNGVQQNGKEVLTWFHRAAEQGHAAAQNNLGAMYGNGYGVTQNKTEAVTWYRKAAEQGNAEGQFNLGTMYEKGGRVTQDKNEANDWYRKAAEKGDANAQNNLGLMYENGEGVEADLSIAKYWYQKAAAQDNEIAKINLISLDAAINAINNAEPLGFKIGVTPLSTVKQKDPTIKYDGASSWTDGEMYISDGTVHQVEGLQSITYIFDKNSRLDVVIMTMNKSYFDKVNNFLKSKYKLVKQEIPYVGNKVAKYKQSNSLIEINAPHMSFDMEVTYQTMNFQFALQKRKAEQERANNNEQKGKF